jgi:hypothetical protein
MREIENKRSRERLRKGKRVRVNERRRDIEKGKENDIMGDGI